jgi:hypothetical protein
MSKIGAIWSDEIGRLSPSAGCVERIELMIATHQSWIICAFHHIADVSGGFLKISWSLARGLGRPARRDARAKCGNVGHLALRVVTGEAVSPADAHCHVRAWFPELTFSQTCKSHAANLVSEAHSDAIIERIAGHARG